MPSIIHLDSDLKERIERLAAARGQSPETILHEALTQYLDRSENPGEKKYPGRHPVGGIITPV
jgi:predicted transcriptional regulator